MGLLKSFLNCKAGDTLWVITREGGEPTDYSCSQFLTATEKFIIATSFINDFDIDETIEYHIRETQNFGSTYLLMFPIEDCFATREAAEEALNRSKLFDNKFDNRK